MKRSELDERIGRYRFYHHIDLGEGVVTPGEPGLLPQQDMVMRNLRSLALSGKRVLDIGCRDGLFSFEAERLGAREVIGVDNDLSLGATEFLIPHLKSKVRMHEKNLFDLLPDTFGKFDVIVFSGVLYHLRYPFHALKLIRNLLAEGGTLLLETAILSVWERHPFLYCPTGEKSPYESTSVTFFNNHGLRSTLESLGYRIESIDHLYGPRLSSTRGVGTRQVLHRWAIRAQRLVPDLIHMLWGKFVIDRAVYVCTPGPSDPEVRGYWDATHPMHTGASTTTP